jgi:hypothetical protein
MVEIQDADRGRPAHVVIQAAERIAGMCSSFVCGSSERSTNS